MLYVIVWAYLQAQDHKYSPLSVFLVLLASELRPLQISSHQTPCVWYTWVLLSSNLYIVHCQKEDTETLLHFFIKSPIMSVVKDLIFWMMLMCSPEMSCNKTQMITQQPSNLPTLRIFGEINFLHLSHIHNI